VLADFHALGARRGAWLVHRTPPGGAAAARADLAGAGLDVAGLERDGRLAIIPLRRGLSPEEDADRLSRRVAGALAKGYSAVWHTHSGGSCERPEWAAALGYDRAWDARFRGLQVITLCPFVVGDLDPAHMLDRFATLAEFHDGVLVAAGDHLVLHERESAPALL
jgi:hypothetical protein